MRNCHKSSKLFQPSKSAQVILSLRWITKRLGVCVCLSVSKLKHRVHKNADSIIDCHQEQCLPSYFRFLSLSRYLLCARNESMLIRKQTSIFFIFLMKNLINGFYPCPTRCLDYKMNEEGEFGFRLSWTRRRGKDCLLLLSDRRNGEGTTVGEDGGINGNFDWANNNWRSIRGIFGSICGSWNTCLPRHMISSRNSMLHWQRQHWNNKSIRLTIRYWLHNTTQKLCSSKKL